MIFLTLKCYSIKKYTLASKYLEIEEKNIFGKKIINASNFCFSPIVMGVPDHPVQECKRLL